MLLKISKSLKLNRNIRVITPFVLVPEININNNVSALLLDINMYPNNNKISYKEFFEYYKSKIYMLETFYYLSNFNIVNGKNIRNNIDLIISIGNFNNIKLIPNNIYFKYCTVGEQALYCSIVYTENNLNQYFGFGNFIINSPDINSQDIFNEFNNSNFNSKYFD